MSKEKEGTTRCPYTQSKKLLEKGIQALFSGRMRPHEAATLHGFIRMKTSEDDAVPDFAEEDKLVAREVAQYLSHVLTGKYGKPLCPFVTRVHMQNGYHLKLVREAPEDVDFDALAKELHEEFAHLSPQKTVRSQGLDVTTAVLAFSHPDCRTSEFGQTLEHARNRLRQEFLEDGHMLAHMFEEHVDPKKTRSYQSRIPLLMARRMHEPDHVFMHSEEEKKAYQKFFPPHYPTGIGG